MALGVAAGARWPCSSLPAILIALWMLVRRLARRGPAAGAGAGVRRRLAARPGSRSRRRRARAAREPGELRVARAQHARASRRTRPAHYLRLLSDAADDDAADRLRRQAQRAARSSRAATGADDGLAVALGGYKNTNTTPIPRVLTRAGAQPAAGGRRVDHGHRRRCSPTRAASSRSTGYSVHARSAAAPRPRRVTLAPGEKRWLNLSASMKGSAFPGQQPALPPERAHHGPLRGLHAARSSPTTSPSRSGTATGAGREAR